MTTYYYQLFPEFNAETLGDPVPVTTLQECIVAVEEHDEGGVVTETGEQFKQRFNCNGAGWESSMEDAVLVAEMDWDGNPNWE